MSVPGNDWNTALTSRSTQGTVYDAFALSVVCQGERVSQLPCSAPSRPRMLGVVLLGNAFIVKSSTASQTLRFVRPVLVPPWTRMPFGARQLNWVSRPFQV